MLLETPGAARERAARPGKIAERIELALRLAEDLL